MNRARRSAPAGQATIAPAAGPPGRDTRGRLLSAAIQLLLAEGMHALSQTRVARAAGLRQSHLTYYFPTRFDLLKAVVEFADASIIGMVDGRPESIPRTPEELRELLARPVLDRTMPRLMLSMHAAADEDPELREWMQGFDARMRERLVATLGQLGLHPQPHDFALFHASMIGIAVQNAWRRDDEFADEARALMHAAFDRLVADAAAPRPRPRTRRT